MQIGDQHLVRVNCDDPIKHKQFSIPQSLLGLRQWGLSHSNKSLLRGRLQRHVFKILICLQVHGIFLFLRIMLTHIPIKIIPYVLRPIDVSNVTTKVRETFANFCTSNNVTFFPMFLLQMYHHASINFSVSIVCTVGGRACPKN